MRWGRTGRDTVVIESEVTEAAWYRTVKGRCEEGKTLLYEISTRSINGPIEGSTVSRDLRSGVSILDK